MRPIRLLAWAVVPLLAACGAEGPSSSAWTGTVRDSAGVTIVSNADRGSWTAGGGWTVVEELRIGVAVGDPELQFGLVNGLDVDDDGRIYVLDQQASRIRVFDADGALLDAFGRRGQGPDELSQGVAGLFLTSDGTLLVPDLMNQRLARFTPTGEPLTAPALDLSHGVPIVWLAGPDRTLFGQVRRMTLPGAPAAAVEPMDLILTRGPDGAVRDTVAVLPSGESFGVSAAGVPDIRIFAPETVWTILSDGRLVTGWNSEYSLHVRDPDGVVTRIVRRDVTRRPVTEGDRQGFRRAILRAWEEAGMPPAMASQMGERIQFGDEWPALAAVLGGPEGTLWVQRVDPDAALDISGLEDLQSLTFGNPEWDVFDGEGRYLGIVEMPDGFTPRRVMEDRLYGIHQDDLGVQRVVRLRLDRGR